MITPLNIHTHLQPQPIYAAIQNCYPETFNESEEGWFSVGIHPWKVQGYQQQYPWALLRCQAALPQVVAIGEAGLDKLCDYRLDEQERVFRQQAALAEELSKPLIIHLVKSTDELLRIRKDLRPSMPWIIHGFRGKPAQAQSLLSHGCNLSFGALYHPESLRLTPFSRLFLETDEADVPIKSLVEKAAEIKGISLEEMKQILTSNVKNTFTSIGCGSENCK